MAIVAEPAKPPPRNAVTAVRLATGIVLIPVVVAAVWFGGPVAIAGLTALCALLALREFFTLGEHAGLRGYRLWTSLCSLGLIFAQWSAAANYWTIGRNLRLTRTVAAPEVSLDAVLFLFLLGAAVLVLISRRPVTESLGGIAISSAGLLFVVLPLSEVIRIDGIEDIGRKLLLFTLVLIWVGDTLAYFVGRWFGRLRMAPQLSPKKTWEGAAANLAGSLVVGYFAAPWLQLDVRHALVLAALANIAGQVGDLLESSYKRSAGVKDSGALLPGHGGMLDRIDALILAAPMVWYYFHLVIRAGA